MSSHLGKPGRSEHHPLFFIYDDDSGNKQQASIDHKNAINIQKRRNLILKNSHTSDKKPQKLSIPTKVESRGNSNNIEDILKFPTESSHAYSYAHMSPNSLALRLNVLKRSMEILKDRPNLFKSIQQIKPPIDESTVNRTQRISSISLEKLESVSLKMYKIPQENHSSESFNEKYHLESNASSAALNAFFRPQIKRSDSMPVNQLYGSKHTEKVESIEEFIQNSDLEDVIKLLGNDYNVLFSNSEVASTLHDLSLSSSATNNRKTKQHLLKNKLLYALSMPFIENSAITSSLLGGQNDSSFQSSAALNLLASQTPHSAGPMSNSSRPFHSITSAKHSTPQSIFTVEVENPWLVKAANDLACLMFGVLKAMIKSLTLMDLIASQFRNFVTEKLLEATNTVKPRSRDKLVSLTDNCIIFAGEIVAISRPGDKGYAWTSMWAKRKNNLIICMFEQIPCDAFDVVITSNRTNSIQEEYQIESISDIAGSLSRHLNFQSCKKLSDISNTLSKELDGENTDSDVAHKDIIDSETINLTRYYTLDFENQEHIPCAITSNPLELDNTKNEIKLKIHSLPYIAGIFVIDSEDHRIISCNNAIAKNLFGRASSELENKSVGSIIPDFSEILNLGLSLSGELDIVPGLVLPEHFFRRFDAVLNCQRGTDSNEEELFLNSSGIIGKHRDGNQILIDVQLRVSSNDIFVLWITYSRSIPDRKSAENIERNLKHSRFTTDSSEVEPKKVRYEDNEYKLGLSLPSQLKLFDNISNQDLDQDTGDSLNRKSSTRRPKSSLFTNSIAETNEDSEDSGSSRSSSEEKDSTSLHLAESSKPKEDIVPSYRIINSVSNKFSEDEMLIAEDEELKLKAEKSPFWPTVVGEKRRTKKFSEFTVVKDMGTGAYGKVVLAQHKEDPEYTIIIKCIDKERILVDTWVRDRKLGTIPSEIQIMAFLNSEPHPNIMRILDFFEDLKYYYLETPIFGDPPAIDLFDFIEVKKGMKEMECKFIFKQVVMAVYHLHKNGIVHRDIKDENVIVDENGIIKLIDFGSAGFTRLGPFDVFVGTIDYASPEVLRGEKYEGKAQDVWALGILLYTMLYKENPFYNVDEIMEGDLRIPFVISDSSQNLIKKILVRDVDKRITITDIVEDEWLRI